MKLFFFAGGSIVYALLVVVVGKFLGMTSNPPNPIEEKQRATRNIHRGA
jgi:hypothetical protein